MCRPVAKTLARATILWIALGISCAVAEATPILYYSFEAPDDTADAKATDNSGNSRDGSLETVGTGTYQYQTSSPVRLSGTKSLLLTENGNDNGGRLVREPPDIDFDSSDWTFSAWFNRADTDNDDFILHLGIGDGYGGSNNPELQLYAHGSNDVSLGYYGASDMSITGTGMGAGEWHHVAVVYRDASELFELYLDGTSAGTDSPSSGFSLSQVYPFVVGGHERMNSQVERWFDGGLDDVALWDMALSSEQIGALRDGVSPMSVPEPGTLTLLAIAAMLFLVVRRRIF